MHSKNSQTHRMVLDGAQVLRNIHVAHDHLRTAIADHATIEVDCQSIAEFDLSFIQLLIAAKRSADKNNKLLKLASPAAGKLHAALERAGFLKTTDDSNGVAAFWSKGSTAP